MLIFLNIQFIDVIIWLNDLKDGLLGIAAFQTVDIGQLAEQDHYIYSHIPVPGV